jgi:hypothetical protein
MDYDTLLKEAKESDPDFALECDRATIQAIHTFQEAESNVLQEQLPKMPVKFSALPYHEYIHDNTPVQSICSSTEHLLWHQHLGHPSDYYLYNAHKHIDGVPKFKHMDCVLKVCPTCIHAKQTKTPAGLNTTRVATQPYQGLSVDFSFAGVKSKNTNREHDYVGLNGETCWILVTDHFSCMKHGECCQSKASPLNWLEKFLKQYSPDCHGKYVHMDQGGELYCNPQVCKLFQDHGYEICPSGADASNQNGPVERGHLMVKNAVHALLIGANLDIKFWPYAFHHWICIDNSLPSHATKPMLLSRLPLETVMTSPHSVPLGAMYGCNLQAIAQQSFVLHPGRASSWDSSHRTTKNIIWYVYAVVEERERVFSEVTN